MLARLGLTVLFALCSFSVHAADYKTYNEAMSAAATQFRMRNVAGAQEPLEAALVLAPDDKSRVRTYLALLGPYRMLPDHQKFMDACEYVLDNADSDAQKSIVARDLVNFIRQRGQQDALIAHYEKRLKNDDDDTVSLAVLAEAYGSIKRDPESSIKYLDRLIELTTKDGKIDVRLGGDLAQQYVAAKRFDDAATTYEKIAPLDDKTTAWYWKEAALAWQKAGDNAKALAAAKKSSESKPETRSELLTFYWNDALGDLFAEAGDKAKAKSHYEAALASTKIEGQKKKTQEKLSALQ